jgi:hypothetical protein
MLKTVFPKTLTMRGMRFFTTSWSYFASICTNNKNTNSKHGKTVINAISTRAKAFSEGPEPALKKKNTKCGSSSEAKDAVTIQKMFKLFFITATHLHSFADPDPELLFTSMRIRILLLIKMLGIFHHSSTDPPGLHFERSQL